MPPEGGLAGLAGAQRGLVRGAQLHALGLSAKAIEHRVGRGLLHRVFPRVFAVGHPALPLLGIETAALLYAGEDAVLSHESAAAIWGLAPTPSCVAVTVIGRTVRPQPGLRMHRVAALDVRDARMHQGVPVTSPARTLIDCAGRGPVDRMLNEARVLGLVTNAQLYQAMDRCPGRTGTGPLRALLEAEQDTGFTRSRAESLLRRLVTGARLESPIFNSQVNGFEVDAVWPKHRVVVEVDGYHAHGHRAAFERDRERDAALIGAGYVVIRVTWRQLTREPMVVLASIVRALAARG